MGLNQLLHFDGEDSDAIKGLVAAGLGVTLIPEITLVDSLPRSTVKLRIRPPGHTLCRCYYPKGKNSNANRTTFL